MNSESFKDSVKSNGLNILVKDPPEVGNALALVSKWLWIGLHEDGFTTSGIDEFKAALFA